MGDVNSLCKLLEPQTLAVVPDAALLVAVTPRPVVSGSFEVGSGSLLGTGVPIV